MTSFILVLMCLIPMVSAADFPEVDKVIGQAIASKTLPGAVTNIGTNEKTLSLGVYGKRDLTTINSSNTIYDLASLTKVVGTATSIMILEEQGKLKTTDKLILYFPEFETEEKNDLTIEDLMRHRSGFKPGTNSIKGESYPDFISRVASSKLQYKPRTDVVYSDLNFILLGDIVQKVSGVSLHEFTQNYIFGPLKMQKTGYFVSEADQELCAPTLVNRKCVPHDPTAFNYYPHNLGHAGLFSTGEDVGRFARMYLNNGELDGVRILKEETVRKMITLPEKTLRGLGWDLLSPYADPPRGEIYAKGISYGHTGYTGTSLWIDPKSNSYYVLLSNRVYLGEEATQKPFTALRRAVATAVARFFY
jgi:CubicO group peptidase (beta-lactamase class C family)